MDFYLKMGDYENNLLVKKITYYVYFCANNKGEIQVYCFL